MEDIILWRERERGGVVEREKERETRERGERERERGMERWRDTGEEELLLTSVIQTGFTHASISWFASKKQKNITNT